MPALRHSSPALFSSLLAALAPPFPAAASGIPTVTSLEETESDPTGDYIPGAVDTVVSLGVTVLRPDGWSGGGRLRYFGAAPLIENNSVRSDPTLLVNLEAGHRFTERLSAFLTVFNVFDAEDSDITYLYESQLPSESARRGHPFPPGRAAHVPRHGHLALLSGGWAGASSPLWPIRSISSRSACAACGSSSASASAICTRGPRAG
jgi:hypothetical protein